MSGVQKWVSVCTLDDLVADAGVCALIDGRQVALFYLPEQQRVYAIDNHDPMGRANVLSRGILGSAGERLFVASPLYKERYCLATGACLDLDELVLDTWQTRIEGNRLLIDPQPCNQLAVRAAV